jgi:hypothetical protein
MHLLYDFCSWLYELPWVVTLQESDNLFPLIETVHVLGIGLMAGTILTLDLRVLGIVLTAEPVASLSRALLPYTWAGFALMAVTGFPLFAAESVKLYANPAFRVKLLLLILAGLNALLFHKTTFRMVDGWRTRETVPSAARYFAFTSAVLWLSVIVAGRLIAVFHTH